MQKRHSFHRNDFCPVCYRPDVTIPLRKNKDILRCLEHFRDLRQEYMVCLSLDSDQILINQKVVAIGQIDSVIAHPREVFAGAVADRAKWVIIAHNHPSGVAEPSKADISTTQVLIAAGQILGIPVIEHIIVTRDEYFSFRSEQML